MPPKPPGWSSLSHVWLSCQTSPLIGARHPVRIFARHATTSTSTRPPSSKYTHLPTRALLRLAGPSGPAFLHALLPCTIVPTPSHSPIYTAFLRANGRLEQDVFIYPPTDLNDAEGSWYIEVGEESVAELMKHLKKHKLRSKFKLERVPAGEMGVWYAWPENGEGPSTSVLGGRDPRPGMGSRWIMKSDTTPKELENGADEAPTQDYTVHRMLNGIAEGQHEMKGGTALPLECNLDFFHGIDFHKGCYLGQELTIRTHHTGVVRKRILPCQIYSDERPLPAGQTMPMYDPESTLPAPVPDANITRVSPGRRERSVGKWLGGRGNIGLALCRLEMVSDIQLTGEGSQFDGNAEFTASWDVDDASKSTQSVKVKPFVPPWLRQKISESMERRQRKPKREEGEEEDEVD